MNRSDVKGPTSELIEVSAWCAANLDHKRMNLGPGMILSIEEFLDVLGPLDDQPDITGPDLRVVVDRIFEVELGEAR